MERNERNSRSFRSAPGGPRRVRLSEERVGRVLVDWVCVG